MLLTKTVKIKWGYRIRKYYIDKGYIFTNINDEFEVKVEDLSKGSEVLVNVKCDCEDCKNPYLKPVYWFYYLKHISKDGKYFCRKCASKGRIENSRKTKLSKSKSFEQWCIENNRQDILERWDYELNDYKPSEITYGSKKNYWFKCNKHKEHKSELKNVNRFTSGQEGSIKCNQCNSFAQWGIDNIDKNFLEKYWSNKNTLNPWRISKSSRNKIWIKCQEKEYHEDYMTHCGEFFIGNRCPYCATIHGKVHPLDSLGKLLENKGLLHIWSDKNKKSPYEYTPFSSVKVWWKCFDNKHNDYKRKICESNIYDFRCPSCIQERKESFLQEKVRLYLEETNYTILHERDCTIIPINPKTKYKLPFDNEVKELKLVIEVMGRQHYSESSGKWFNTDFDLHKQQLYDRYKRIKAIQQGYYYLDIPFWTDNKNETWKTLINNKLNEILNLKEVI